MGHQKHGNEHIACGEDGQGPRPEDGRLGVKQDGNDQLADQHDRIDDGDEGRNFIPARIAHGQYQEEAAEQQADDGNASPDIATAWRCIEQAQALLRHNTSQCASRHPVTIQSGRLRGTIFIERPTRR
jgi:hypothetical protein